MWFTIMKTFMVIYYTCFLLYLPANIGAVDNRLYGETTAPRVNTEDIRGRSSSMIEKFRMSRSKRIESEEFFTVDPDFLDWVHGKYNETGETRDSIIEDKKREDAYQKTAAEKSPHSLLLVSVFDNKGKGGSCTGSLLTTRWVLTAAHCVTPENLKALEVVMYAGGNSLQELLKKQPVEGSQIASSSEFYPHPNYYICYDVALVKSKKEFSLSKTINVIKLSNQPWGFKGFKECTLTGFGVVSMGQQHADDSTRKTLQLKIENPCNCSSILSELFIANSSTYLCSQLKEDYGICVGDSGGGLVCDGEVRGIAMLMVKFTDAMECELNYNTSKIVCGGTNVTSVFQNTYLVREWVHSYLENREISKVTTKNCKDQKYHGCNFILVICLFTLNVVIQF